MATTEVIKQRKEEANAFKEKMFDLERRAKKGEEVGKKVGKGFIIKIGDKYNFIDSHKNVITKDIWFNHLKKLNEHYILAEADGRCNIFDIRTAEFINYGISGKPWWLKSCDTEFHDGMLRVQWSNGSWDYLNEDGYTILGPSAGVIEATVFEDGEATITREGGRETVIDEDGETISGESINAYKGEYDGDEDDVVNDIVNEVMRRARNGLV